MFTNLGTLTEIENWKKCLHLVKKLPFSTYLPTYLPTYIKN